MKKLSYQLIIFCLCSALLLNLIFYKYNHQEEAIYYCKDYEMGKSTSINESQSRFQENPEPGTAFFNQTVHSSIAVVAFSPYGNIVASGGSDGLVKLRNMSIGDGFLTVFNEGNPIRSLDFSSNGKFLAYSTSSTTNGDHGLIKVVEVETQKEILVISMESRYTNSVVFSPDSKLLAAGNSDGSISFFKVSTGIETQTLQGHTSNVNTITFSPDGTLLASGSSDGTVKIWEVETGTEIYSLTGNEDGVGEVCFSPDGTKFAACSWAGNVTILDRDTKDVILSMEPSIENIVNILFTPDSDAIVTGSYEEIKFWEFTYGAQIYALAGHHSNVESMEFSPDGTTLISGANDGSIIMWQVSLDDAEWTDADHDRISDTWEQTNGLDSTDFFDKFTDPDQDNLINILEFQFGTSPFQRDTDNDSLWDGYEWSHGMNGTQNDENGDLDGDGIPNWYEFQNGLQAEVDDAQEDTDGDGMPNLYEYQTGLLAGTKDAFGDIDADGMPNLYEYTQGLNNTKNDAHEDTDGDGMPNLYEYQTGLLAGTKDAFDDGDGDLIPNLYEYTQGLNNTKNDAHEDTDGDGMPNLYEYLNGLLAGMDDASGDIDADGMPNLFEYKHDFDNSFDDSYLDKDNDWVSNLQEYRSGSNPSDFFSVPLLVFSCWHFIAFLTIIVLGSVTGIGYLQIKRKLKQKTLKKFGKMQPLATHFLHSELTKNNIHVKEILTFYEKSLAIIHWLLTCYFEDKDSTIVQNMLESKIKKDALPILKRICNMQLSQIIMDNKMKVSCSDILTLDKKVHAYIKNLHDVPHPEQMIINTSLNIFEAKILLQMWQSLQYLDHWPDQLISSLKDILVEPLGNLAVHIMRISFERKLHKFSPLLISTELNLPYISACYLSHYIESQMKREVDLSNLSRVDEFFIENKCVQALELKKQGKINNLHYIPELIVNLKLTSLKLALQIRKYLITQTSEEKDDGIATNSDFIAPSLSKKAIKFTLSSDTKKYINKILTEAMYLQ